MNSENIAIIGAGLMGHGIAQVFASQGYRVSLFDVSEEVLAKAIDNIRANITLLARNGIGNTEEIEPAIGRIGITLSMKEAALGAQFVIEAVPETELRQGIFQKLIISVTGPFWPRIHRSSE
jgi:3-hydroxyacyl-CoA dehydrogenase